MKPVSVQLYTLRELMAKDFVGVLKKVAEIGYKGVEPAGFYGIRPKEVRKIIEDHGMVISSSHSPGVNTGNIGECVELAEILGVDMLCCGFGPKEFATLEDIKKTADKVTQMCAGLKKYGLKLFMHNHYWEYAVVDGKLAIDHFIELAPDVLFELDTYWASNFGANDPAAQVARFKKQIPLLHIKDGPLVKDQAMVAVGSGKMDFKKVIGAADPKVLRWLVVELDKCDTDMLKAVEDSYKYLTSSGLGEGRK
jgi:sugar phosphate isomerase/epimerase